VNVDSECFHEGRGAGKSTAPGGRIIVSEKQKLREKIVAEKTFLPQARCAGKDSFLTGQVQALYLFY